MTERALDQTKDGRSAARLLQEVLLFNDALQYSICANCRSTKQISMPCRI